MNKSLLRDAMHSKPSKLIGLHEDAVRVVDNYLPSLDTYIDRQSHARSLAEAIMWTDDMMILSSSVDWDHERGGATTEPKMDSPPDEQTLEDVLCPLP